MKEFFYSMRSERLVLDPGAIKGLRLLFNSIYICPKWRKLLKIKDAGGSILIAYSKPRQKGFKKVSIKNTPVSGRVNIGRHRNVEAAPSLMEVIEKINGGYPFWFKFS